MQNAARARPVVAAVIVAAALFLAWRSSALAADVKPQSISALKAALAKNAEHASRWLDEQDFKSLVQSTGGALLLAEVLKAQGDGSAWQSALGQVIGAARDLQAVAKDEDRAKCNVALAALERTIASVDKLEPAGRPRELPKVAIRPLMLTLDSVQADAKVALLIGNAAAAKKQAAVLAELSRLVSNSRSTEKWLALSADFSEACEAAAASTETDAKTVRQLLRGISQRCEACHENSRPRQ